MTNIGPFHLIRERFESAGVPVGEAEALTPATPFGQNVRSKSFFESAIAASWQKSTQGIFDTGRWLQQAREELDRDVYNALRLPFCIRTRQRLIAIVAHPVLATHVSQLPPSWGTHYALAEIDDHDLLRAALAGGQIHPGLQRKDVRRAVGLPPKPARRMSKGNDQAQPDPIAVWAAFSPTDKSAILENEGRCGLVGLMSPTLLADFLDHLTGLAISKVPSKATNLEVSLTHALRLALLSEDEACNALTVIRSKLRANGRSLNDVVLALGTITKKTKRGKISHRFQATVV